MGETSGTATAARGTLYLLLLSIFGAIAAGGLLAAAVGDIWSGWTSRELASPFLARCSASQQCELRHSGAAPRAEREGSCRPPAFRRGSGPDAFRECGERGRLVSGVEPDAIDVR